LYEAAADVVLDTASISPEESAEKINEILIRE
jgi:hypothetical protein